VVEESFCEKVTFGLRSEDKSQLKKDTGKGVLGKREATEVTLLQLRLREEGHVAGVESRESRKMWSERKMSQTCHVRGQRGMFVLQLNSNEKL
jgi:hypothetical protein